MTVQFYTPKLVIRNITEGKDVDILGIIRLKPGKRINLFEVVGIGSGALAAAGLASSYKPNEEMHILLKQINDQIKNIKTLKTKSLHKNLGLYNTNVLQEKLSQYFVPTFNDAVIPITLPLLNLTADKIENFSSLTHQNTAISEALAAAIALPLLFTPFSIGKHKYCSAEKHIEEIVAKYVRAGFIPISIQSNKILPCGLQLETMIRHLYSNNLKLATSGISIAVKEYAYEEKLTGNKIEDLIDIGKKAAEGFHYE